MDYNWQKILEDYSDSELFQALKEQNLPVERRITAEKILLERRVISKNAEGNYHKEIIDEEFLKLTEKLSKSNSEENVLNILVQNGLDKESSLRLIEYYYDWKRKHKKKQIPWIILFLIAFLMEITSEVVSSLNFMTSTISVILFMTMIPILWPILVGSGFSKNKLFKIVAHEE